MPKGPRGEKRPADAVGLAVMIGRIAVGDVEDRLAPKPDRAAIASKGGAARAAKLTPQRRSEIAKTAATARVRDRVAPGEGEDS